MQPEYLIERKKLKQQLFSWKALCVVLIAAVMTASSMILEKTFSGFEEKTSNADYIGSIYIEGMILEDKKRDEKLRKICDNEKVKALVVYINSPGGSVGGSEELYNLIRKIGTKKPVVAVMNTLAASGGYMISLAADHVVAHNSTLTGSIGVIWENAEVTDLADKVGIKFNSFKSGPLKAAPNPTEKVTPEVEEAAMALIKDSHNYFIEMVAERRKLPKEYVAQVSDGRVYTGRQAYELKLVDKLGGTDEALEWLRTEKKIDPKLKIIEIELKTKSLLNKFLGEDIEQKLHGMFFNKGLFALMS